jgi:hypothetical protein
MSTLQIGEQQLAQKNERKKEIIKIKKSSRSGNPTIPIGESN